MGKGCRRYIIVGGIVLFILPLLLLCVAFGLTHLVNSDSQDDREAREELKKLYDMLELGDTLDTVDAKCACLPLRHLTVTHDRGVGGAGNNEIVVFTPPKFLADNWVMSIVFSPDDRVGYIYIRENDTARAYSSPKPDGAPVDRIAPGVIVR